jgi:phage-related protein
MGFAIYQAQLGGRHVSAKPLKGFKGAGVLEVVADHEGDTFGAVYTVRFARVVYVLHAKWASDDYEASNVKEHNHD